LALRVRAHSDRCILNSSAGSPPERWLSSVSLDLMRADLIVAGIALFAIGIVGLWLLALPWTSKYRRSSRWFRDVAVAAGLAAVFSSSGHALVLFYGHALSRVTFLEMQILSQVVSGIWMGLSFSLFHSSDFWEPRPPSRVAL
jgi:hypothetical protein